MVTEDLRARYILRLTWRWNWRHGPGPRAVGGMALLLRYLGFAVEPACQGADHVCYRLRPRDGTDLPLGQALARLEAWEDEAIADYPGTTWLVCAELPCPRQTTAYLPRPTGEDAFDRVPWGPVLPPHPAAARLPPAAEEAA